MEHSLITKISVATTAASESAQRPRFEQARATPAKEEPSTKPEPASAEKVAAAVSKINDFIQITRRDLQFSVHDETGMTVVKVLDSDTDEVIRQIPAEEVLAIAANLEEVRGLLFKAKA